MALNFFPPKFPAKQTDNELRNYILFRLLKTMFHLYEVCRQGYNVELLLNYMLEWAG